MFNKIYSFLKVNFVLVFIYLSVFLSTLFFSPIFTLYMLALPIFYFLYIGKYKDIFFLCIFFFFNWYFMFTLLMIGYEGKILIGGVHTIDILYYLVPILLKYRFLKRFSFITVFFLHILADSYDFIIYIPSIFN